jgi:hypothetical protein
MKEEKGRGKRQNEMKSERREEKMRGREGRE